MSLNPFESPVWRELDALTKVEDPWNQVFLQVLTFFFILTFILRQYSFYAMEFLADMSFLLNLNNDIFYCSVRAKTAELCKTN